MFYSIKLREYWQYETLTYLCNDEELGLEASNNITIEYSCDHYYPVGNYTAPQKELDWPNCMERTTTIKPRTILRYLLIIRNIFVHTNNMLSFLIVSLIYYSYNYWTQGSYSKI